MAFGAADLDPAKGACRDFAGYANDKWLGSNPIPGDKTSWGPFDVLELRSLGIQRQLAERAASEATPRGIDKIIADFWATGMDEAKVNAQGIAPMKDRLAAIDALTDKDTVAGYLRTSAA
ncbi:MAG TPA: peptidase, partial [Burkholderiales bacterium]|nr:peptidase [Burkholderiales bacterium]